MVTAEIQKETKGRSNAKFTDTPQIEIEIQILKVV